MNPEQPNTPIAPVPNPSPVSPPTPIVANTTLITPPIAAPTMPPLPPKKSPLGMIIAIVGILVLIGLGWWFMQSKATGKTQSYTNSQYGYQVNFPTNWQVIGGNPADVRLSDTAAANSIPESGVHITVEDIANQTLSDVALQGQLTPDKVKITEMTFAGAQAIQATTTGCDTNGFVGCGQTIRYILHNNQVYTLDPLLADKGTADKIFNTFKFTN